NVNEETRLITKGPLAGDIAVSTAPTKAPYHYGIILYRLTRGDRYVELLRFTARTREGDGNDLAVIDAEMPRILQRLHLWKPGVPLPPPERMGRGCTAIEFRDGIEWCH